MIFFNTKKTVFFITKEFNKVIKSRCDIILSPEFYWVKKIDLNIKSSYQVKKMAPSIFDGVIPKGDYEYRVFKIAKNRYLLIAFDIRYILKQISDLGIELKFVDRIFTAQSEFQGDDISLKIDDNYGLINVEGILAKVPIKLLESDAQIDNVLIDKKVSNNYIYSSSLQKVNLTHKDFKTLLLLLLLLNIFLISSIVRNKKNISLIESQKAQFIRKNSLPATSFQIKSMEEELKKREKIQISIREAIEYLANFKLSKSEYFTLLKYNDKTLFYKILLNGKKREKEFKNYLLKYRKKDIKIEELR